jgi:predicted nucleic-acid-binding protein
VRGLDTNVLVRYIVHDDPTQARSAARFIESECSRETPGFVNHIVLCELAWVLEECYRLDRERIIRVLEQVLRVAQLQVDEPQVVWRALDDYRASKADFADHLLARVTQARGCGDTVTFDADAAKAQGFKLLR